MINMKLKVFFGACFFIFLSSFALAKSKVEVNKIVAVVNSDVITQVDLDKRMAHIQRQYKMMKKPIPSWSKMRKSALDELIDSLLQVQTAKRSGIKISDEEINKVIGNIAKSHGMTIAKMKEVVPKQEGMSFNEFRERIREQALISRVQQQFLSRGINVSKKDIDAVLRNPPKIKDIPAEYHVFDVLLEFPEDITENQVKGIRKKAKIAAAKLKKKGDVNVLVDEVREVLEGQVVFGNDLGWRKEKDFPEIFVEYIPKMKEGRVVGPIEAPNGLHFLKMLAIKKSKAVRAKINRNQATEIAFQRKLEKKLKPWLKELRKNAYIIKR